MLERTPPVRHSINHSPNRFAPPKSPPSLHQYTSSLSSASPQQHLFNAASRALHRAIRCFTNYLKNLIQIFQRRQLALPIFRPEQRADATRNRLPAQIAESHFRNRFARACASNDGNCVRLLIQQGGSISSATFFEFLESGGERALCELLAIPGIDLNFRNPIDSTPLHVTSARGFPLLTRLLLERGADPNAQNQRGRTPLHTAYQMGNLPIINSLLQHGGSMGIVEHEGLLPLQMVNRRDGAVGPTPFISACITGRVEQVESFLRLGVSPNIRDLIENTPLHILSHAPNNCAVMETLLNLGADIEAVNVMGYTPLLAVCLAGMGLETGLIRLLLVRGASVAPPHLNGNTALHSLASSPRFLENRPNAYPEIIQLLIEAGNPINARNAAGRTPLDLARLNNNEPIVNALIAAGEEIGIRA